MIQCHVKVLSPVLARETFSIKIMETDQAGATSQTILEVEVTPGPNMRAPYFEKLAYDVEVKAMTDIRTMILKFEFSD